MQNPRALPILIIVALLIVAGIVLVFSFGPAALGPVSEAPPQDLVEDLRQDISSGTKMELAYPLKSVFSVGESFSATLGLSNTLDHAEAFTIEITQTSGPENGPTISYQRSTGILQPGASFFTDITFTTTNAEPGSYLYDITAFITESGDTYAQKTIAFTLTGTGTLGSVE